MACAGAAGTSSKDQKCWLWDSGGGSRPLCPVLWPCPSMGEGSHWRVSLALSSHYPLQQASCLQEKKIMDLYEDPDVQNPFLFLRAMEGTTSTFESVAYPSWFIATASVAGQPITLTKDRGRDYNTNFYFEPMEYNRALRVQGQGQRLKSRTFV